MQNNFKVINNANQNLITETTSLQKKITALEKEIVNLKMTYPKGTTQPKKSVASPAQTVAGKDFSNPLMAVDLPKVQQTQGTIDFPTHQNSLTKTEIWDTLGEPSGKFDYLVKYSSSTEQDSPESIKKMIISAQTKEKKFYKTAKTLKMI
ncbi:Uncharacterized protein Adt_26291 [Abeliophyllum distichum]|uniref:Uncharacterized protein n=1 Tax=Abeliophyllum distichum TaxID=126358 RepID=A0ABD1RQL3_9LAMI